VEDLAVRFLAPHWLYAIAALPLIFILFMFDEHGRQKRFSQFIGKALWGRLVPELDPKARRRKLLTWLGAMVFLFLALARPQWGTHEEVVHASGLDVMIALDISNSMNTEDVAPSRLLKAKHLVRTLAERLQGDRVGLVSFAGSGYLACPLTTDTEYLLEQLSIQTPKLLATQGTDIGIGLEAALKALDRASEEGDHHEQSSEPSSNQASRVIILVTDGEDFEGHAAEAADQLKNEGVKLYIFGVGTQKGGPIPVRDEDGTLRGYKKDRDGQAVLSTFKPDAMMQLASAAGGQYWNASTDEGEVTELLKDMGALHQGELAEHHYLTYEERFQYPLAIAIFLFLLELTLATRKRAAALVFAVLCLAAALKSPEARAEAPVDAYLENQKGIDAYKKGQIEEARKRFGSAQALDPAAPELQYNQGLVQLEGGDPDAAIQDFRDAAQGAMKTGNTGLAGRSLFNLGSALTKKGDINGAIQSYLATIDAAHKSAQGKPDAKSAELESDARKNIELLVQQQQKQKQDQQQQQQNQQQQQQQQQQQDQNQKNNSGNDQQKNQDKEQDKKQDQGQDQKQQEQQQQQQNQQQQQQQYETGSGNRNFKSEKLSEEDAERVMAELKNKEQDLQVRQAIKKQNANRENDYKDW
jgi:Ca-activated chloride channel family protein